MQNTSLLLVASLLVAAAWPAALAARVAELAPFSDNDGKFDRTKIPIFQQQVLRSIFPEYIFEDAAWTEVAVRLMEGIMPDFDFSLDGTTVVPPTLVPGFGNFVSGPKHYCGRISRLWIRMPFHDCGTYNRKTRKGGCNGSLRLEIPTDQGFAFKTGDAQSALFPGQTFPFTFNTEHSENNGFAASVVFFDNARKGLSDKSGKAISWADTEVLGGILALWTCGGDIVKFRPGRYDAQVPDRAGLLPSPLAKPEKIIKAFHRMGLTQLDAFTLSTGSHSAAAFMRGRMDSTPQDFDNQWAKEALDIARYNKQALICDMEMADNFVAGQGKVKEQCAMQFVVDFAKMHTTGSYMKAFAGSNQYFNAQFAASFAKMVNQLSPDFVPACPPDDFDGFKGDDQETDEERKETIRGWKEYYSNKEASKGRN